MRDPLLINDLLAQGYGMAIVPLDATRYHPELTVVPGTPVVPDRTLWILYHSDLKNSARVRAVVDFLYEMWRPSLDFEWAQLDDLRARGHLKD